jgi:hypothetical protein
MLTSANPVITVGATSLFLLGPVRMLEADGSQLPMQSPLRALIEGNLIGPTRDLRFSASLVALTRETLSALQSACRREEFSLRLVDDGEIELLVQPQNVAGGEWQLSIAGVDEDRKTQDRLLLELSFVLGQIQAICNESKLSYEEILARAPSQISWFAKGDA